MPNGADLKIDLSDKNTVNMFGQALREVISSDSVAQAKKISKGLGAILDYDKDITKSRPDLAAYYEKVINKCRWIALGTLSENEIVDLFQTKFLLIFEEDVNLWDKLKQKLVTVPFVLLEERDLFKKRIIKALRANREELTPEKIKRGEQILPGNFGNWIVDYDEYVGADLVESVKFSEYLVNTPNTKSLSKESREKLRKFFNFYEKLKASSAFAAGAEEAIDFLNERDPGMLIDGVYYRVDMEKTINDIFDAEETINKVTGVAVAQVAPASPVTAPFKPAKAAVKAVSTAQLKSLYMGSVEEQKKVSEWEGMLISATAGVAEKLSKELLKSVNVPLSKKIEKEKIVALLRLLIKSKKLDELIYSDKEINAEVRGAIKEPRVLERFKVNPRDPGFVKILIRRILIDKARVTESESARIAAQLSTLAQKVKWEKAANMAYFDVKTNSFKWV